MNQVSSKANYTKTNNLNEIMHYGNENIKLNTSCSGEVGKATLIFFVYENETTQCYS
jgi:hypothetical protein